MRNKGQNHAEMKTKTKTEDIKIEILWKAQ